MKRPVSDRPGSCLGLGLNISVLFPSLLGLVVVGPLLHLANSPLLGWRQPSITDETRRHEVFAAAAATKSNVMIGFIHGSRRPGQAATPDVISNATSCTQRKRNDA